MVDIAPGTAFLLALNNAFQASRAGAPRANPVGIPSLAGATDSAQGSPGGLASSSIGGGVPGTATTGPNALNALIGGEPIGNDPIARQTANAFLGGNEPGERGDLGAGVTGGNVGALLSVLGGITAVPSILASLVASDAAGLPLDPSLLSGSALARLVSDGGGGPSDLFNQSVARGREFGGIVTNDGQIVGDFGTPRTVGAGTVNAIRGGAIGGASGIFGGPRESDIDRGRSERTLSRERTTGRAAGPV